MLASYIHNLDPVIFSISNAIKLRWYGLAYLLAFLIGFYLLKRLGDKKLWVLPGEKASDFITFAAIFGVFLGGRIGNIIFYQWSEFTANPIMIFKVWEGGMASHGGIIGLMIFTLVYSWKQKVSWTGLGDGLCVVAPIGIMLGRLANFINGELYGRIDKSFAWSMKFPKALYDPSLPEHANLHQAQQIAISNDSHYAAYSQNVDKIRQQIHSSPHQPENTLHSEYFNLTSQDSSHLNAAIRNQESTRQAIGELLEPRYPSQLFQAAGEGLCLFLILYITRMCFKKLPHGILTGMFFLFYAIFRISMENFRQQETEDVTLLGTTYTMGQFLSIFMIFIGLGFIIQAIIRPRYLKSATSSTEK